MKSKEKTTIIVFLILIILYLICKYVFPTMGFYIAVLTVIVPALKVDRRTPLLSHPLVDNQGFKKVG